MDAIFTHHDSPFFKSAIPGTVDPLPYNEFSQFLRKKFTKGQRKNDDETLEKVFEMANNISGDIQQLCEVLWEVTSEREIIGMNKLKSALELIFSREQKSYENQSPFNGHSAQVPRGYSDRGWKKGLFRFIHEIRRFQ
jgi:hypothetical protein